MSRRWIPVVLGALMLGATTFYLVAREVPESVEIIHRWNQHRAAGLVSQAMELLEDDALIFGYALDETSDRSTFVELLHAQAVAGWQVIDSGCEPRANAVQCRYRQQDVFLRAMDVELTGTHRYVVGDRIIRADRNHDLGSQDAAYAAVAAFREWVHRNHPELEPVIWSSDDVVFYSTRRGAQAVLDILDDYLAERRR